MLQFSSLLLIIECDCLESLVEGMPSLKTLIIVNCPRLSSLPKHLLALQTLVIKNCESLEFDLGNRNSNGEREGKEEDGTRGFESLQILIFIELPKLKILLRWLLIGPTTSNTTPVSLFISKCDNFRALWEEGESLRPCLVDRKFSVFSIQTFRKQGKRV